MIAGEVALLGLASLPRPFCPFCPFCPFARPAGQRDKRDGSDQREVLAEMSDEGGLGDFDERLHQLERKPVRDEVATVWIHGHVFHCRRQPKADRLCRRREVDQRAATFFAIV